MSETIKQVLRDAIAQREKELDELRAKLRELESEEPGTKRRSKRTRKQTGLKEGSIPSLILKCLQDAGRPMAAAEIADRVSKSGKKVESRFVAAAVSRYIESGRFFRQTDDGKYEAKN